MQKTYPLFQFADKRFSVAPQQGNRVLSQVCEA
jgi:hypothetical protein